MKFELNLFQNNIADLKDYPKFGSQEFIDIAYNAAAESITKNSNAILPLNKKMKILVTGPTANSMKYLNGGWSYNFWKKLRYLCRGQVYYSRSFSKQSR
jgi:beta-glucosidase